MDLWLPFTCISRGSPLGSAFPEKVRLFGFREQPERLVQLVEHFLFVFWTAACRLEVYKCLGKGLGDEMRERHALFSSLAFFQGGARRLLLVRNLRKYRAGGSCVRNQPTVR